MTEQNKNVRITRATAKKRAAAATAEENVVIKKRVVLGELPNQSNVVVPMKSCSEAEPQKPKCKTKTKVKKRQANTTTRDIDVNLGDPQMCEAYASDIYEYLRKMEVDPERRPLPDYMEEIQKDVNAIMRGVLVDWLVEVAGEYKLLPESLYLSVSYIDRYLSMNALTRQRLQLLGVSSLLIASKYEEISPPKLDEFCYITDHTYTNEEVVQMEADILKYLRFEMGNPTIKTFLGKFISVAQENHKIPNLQFEFLGYYLAELTLLEYDCVKFLPSLAAASVIFLARFIIKPKIHPWNATLEKHLGYKPADLKECVLIIHDLYLSRRGGSLQALRGKYKQREFKCVATVPSPPEIPADYFEDIEE